MSIFSKLRRTIITEGNFYKVKDLFGDYINEGEQEVENDPEFYNVETHRLKLGELCRKEIEKNVTPTVEWNNNKYSTYCALLQLSNIAPKNMQGNIHTHIDIIYNFLIKELSVNNTRKFRSLINVIFNYENPANTLELIADYIEKGEEINDVKKSLDLFRKKDVKEEDIEEFLRTAKFTAYKEYERSFVGDHFSSKEYKLYLKYKSDLENRSIYSFIKDVMGGEMGVKSAINYLHGLILNNYNAEDMTKGDLVCEKPLYDQNGNVVIPAGAIVEVKKLDYAGDSYLSEFFAIYKDSNLSEDAKTPEFYKIYNEIIDGLYLKFDSENKSMLGEIKFSGIIYDENIFIKAEDISLYWSNKGRGSCNKDHRLSIRYKIEKPTVLGYVYEKNKDILIPKNISISQISERILCPINQNVSETFNINKIVTLLTEGRKEEARAKYPDVPESDFNYYVENDPSGNQKYLEWLLKYYFQVNPRVLVEYIKFFHQNQNMFIEKDINRHTPNSLDREIDDVKEKILKREQKKKAKKESLRLYEDDRWLVISPKSWQASCYYGAGTKWCVTMKDNSSYWNKYSKNASFFFIIDKTKLQDDPLYKVAYRKIGRKGKYELWNAPDYEISNSADGQKYFQELPEEMKERIDMQHLKDFPVTGDRPEWIDNDPRSQALVNGLNSDIIEDIEDYHYGMPIYLVDDSFHYVVGDSGEMDNALRDYYDQYDDSDLMEYYDHEGYYLRMGDEYGFIEDEVQNYLDNTSDREKIDGADLLGKESDLEAEINELESQLDTEEDEEEINDIVSRVESLREDLNNLVEEAEEIIRDSERDEWERCFRNGPKECLIDDRGWFSNARELYHSGLVYLDRTDLIDSILGNSDWDLLAPYGYDEFRDDEDGYWYVFKIDY